MQDITCDKLSANFYEVGTFLLSCSLSLFQVIACEERGFLRFLFPGRLLLLRSFSMIPLKISVYMGETTEQVWKNDVLAWAAAECLSDGVEMVHWQAEWLVGFETAAGRLADWLFGVVCRGLSKTCAGGGVTVFAPGEGDAAGGQLSFFCGALLHV